MEFVPKNDRTAITAVLSGIVKEHVVLIEVHDGEDIVPVSTVESAVEAIMAVDEATIVVNLPDGRSGWIFFVMGNDPEEVVCDHTVNLEPFISPIVDPWWEI